MKKFLIMPILLLGLFLVTGCHNNTVTFDNNGTTTEDLKIEDITFSNISLTFDGSITNIKATMKNNTNEIQNFTVNVTLYDDNNKKVKTFRQIVEDLEVDRPKTLQTGIIGDYSYIKNVKFEVVY